MADKKPTELKPFIIADAEAEGAEGRPDPYVVQFEKDGPAFDLADPMQIDWQDAYLAASSESPFEVLGLIVPDDIAEEFFDRSMTTYAMRKMVDGWREHYGDDVEMLNQRGPDDYANRAARRLASKKKNRKK